MKRLKEGAQGFLRAASYQVEILRDVLFWEGVPGAAVHLASLAWVVARARARPFAIFVVTSAVGAALGRYFAGR